MTVRTIAGLGQLGTDFAAGNYNISYNVAWTDGTADFSAPLLVQVPIGSALALINLLIPTKIAAFVSAQTGVLVLPTQVFFTPFA